MVYLCPVSTCLKCFSLNCDEAGRSHTFVGAAGPVRQVQACIPTLLHRALAPHQRPKGLHNYQLASPVHDKVLTSVLIVQKLGCITSCVVGGSNNRPTHSPQYG